MADLDPDVMAAKFVDSLPQATREAVTEGFAKTHNAQDLKDLAAQVGRGRAKLAEGRRK
jgi:hypothetical protein